MDILYDDGNEIMFRSNNNGIEWKFIVIDKINKIMCYTEKMIRNFFRKMVSITWNKNEWNWMIFKALKSKEKIFWILYNNDGNEIILSFRSNNNGIEWKFIVIDRIMYYKENIIFRIDNFYYIKLKWRKMWKWITFSESIKNIKK